MRYSASLFLIFSMISFFGMVAGAQLEETSSIYCLPKAYPILRVGSDLNSVVFPDGDKFIFDDGVPVELPRDFDRLFTNPTSLLQMFLISYHKSQFHTPHFDEDPGRIRLEKFFRKLYGTKPEIVTKDLVRVRWVDGSTQMFQKKYGAAQALQLVAHELAKLVKQQPEMKKYLKSPLGGTYEWRVIDGTQNLSTHSFGIAIDINTKYTDYWRWDITSPTDPLHYRNRIPLEIVSIFEKHGFIWGGKWYHYDTMHFEYRPELLMNPEACYSAHKP